MVDNSTFVTLELENGHYNSVNIYWVDQENFRDKITTHGDLEKALQASESLQVTLDPGESYLQGSVVGDYWIARDVVDNERLLMLQAWKGQEVFIRGTERRLPQKGSVLDLISAAHRPTEPVRNFALDFDGENDVVIIPHRDDLRFGPEGHGYEWTLEAWVYRQRENVEDPILEKSNARTGGFSLRIGQDNRVQAGIMSSTTFLYGAGDTEIKARRWYHIAATFRGRTDFKFTDRYEKIWTSPSDRYQRNVTFYRPIPPAGYVALGDICQPGFEEPLTTFEDGTVQLERRVLVALNDAALVRESAYERVWPTELTDETSLSIWQPRPIAAEEEERAWAAMGYVVKTAEHATPPAADVLHSVATAKLVPAPQPGAPIWSNVFTADFTGDRSEADLSILPLLGTGFFIANEPDAAARHWIVDPQVLEDSRSQIDIYLNGQRDHAPFRPLQQSLDLASARQALDLNGVDQFLRLPTLDENVDFSAGCTLEAWVLFRRHETTRAPGGDEAGAQNNDRYPILVLEGVGNNHTLNWFFDRATNQLVLQLQQSGPEITMQANNFLATEPQLANGTAADSPLLLEMDRWIHVAVTIEADRTYTFFKNGRVHDDPEAGNRPEGDLPASALRDRNFLGRDHEENYFNGSIADLRIWNASRREQIDGYFNREIGFLPNLVAYWPLNDGPQSDQVRDYTGNPFDIRQLDELEVFPAGGTQGFLSAAASDRLDLRVDPDAGLTGNLTIECWIRLDEAVLQNTVLLRNSGRWSLELVATDGAIRLAFFFKLAGDQDWRIAVSHTELNLVGRGWTHVALRFNATKLDQVTATDPVNPLVEGMFVGGQFVDLILPSPALRPLAEPDGLRPPGRLTIGYPTNAVSRLWIAEIRLWNALVPPKTIAGSRFYQLTASDRRDAKLIAYWPLDGSLADHGPQLLATDWYKEENTSLATPDHSEAAGFAADGPTLTVVDPNGVARDRPGQSFQAGGQLWSLRAKASARLGLTAPLTIDLRFKLRSGFSDNVILLRNEGLWSLELIRKNDQNRLGFFYKQAGDPTAPWSVALTGGERVFATDAWQRIFLRYDPAQATDNVAWLAANGDRFELDPNTSGMEPYRLAGGATTGRFHIGHPDQRDVDLLLAEVLLWEGLQERTEGAQPPLSDQAKTALIGHWPLAGTLSDSVYRPRLFPAPVSREVDPGRFFVPAGPELRTYATAPVPTTVSSLQSGDAVGSLHYPTGSNRLDLLPVADAEVSGDLTVELWLRPNDLVDTSVSVLLVANRDRWSLELVPIDAGWRLVFFFNIAAADEEPAWEVASVAIEPSADWMHLAVRFDGAAKSVQDFWLDGAANAPTANPDSLSTPSDLSAVVSGARLLVGHPADIEATFLLAEVRLWDLLRDEFLILRSKDYQLNTEQRSDPNLVVYWPLNGTDAELGPLQLSRIVPPPPEPEEPAETDADAATNVEGDAAEVTPPPPPPPEPVFSDGGPLLSIYGGPAVTESVTSFAAGGSGWHLQSNPSNELADIPSTIQLAFHLAAAPLDSLVLIRREGLWSIELIPEGDEVRIAFFFKPSVAAGAAWESVITDPIDDLTGSWQQLALVFAGNTARVFRNGALIPIDASPPAEDPFELAFSVPPGRELLIGHPAESEVALSLNEIRLWTLPLPAQYLVRYAAYRLPVQDRDHSGLVAYWPLHADTENLRTDTPDTVLAYGRKELPEGVFIQHDLKLNRYAPDQSFYRWNSASDLRLLPYSIVPEFSDAPIKIGALENQNSLMFFGLEHNTHFAGQVDSVRIWKIARQATEIRAFWNQKLNAAEEEEVLLRYYRFDEGQGEVIHHTTGADAAVDSDKQGLFGGANQIRYVRMWKEARQAADIASNRNRALLEKSEEEELATYYFHFPLEDTEANAGNPVNQAAVRAAPIIAEDQLSFTLELQVKIDTFVLSGEEHYLLFKQDSWALLLYREAGELYLAFTYDYRQNYFRAPWRRVEAFDTPLSQLEWVHVAVVGDWASGRGEIRMYINGKERRVRDESGTITPLVADRVVPLDFDEMRLNTQIVRMGEEGKPKWTESNLLLMDGLAFAGAQVLSLPAITASFDQGLTIEAWVFLQSSTAAWPILALSDPAGEHAISLGVEAGADANTAGKLTFRVARGSDRATVTLRSEVDLELDRWIHVAATLGKETPLEKGVPTGPSFTRCRLYIDGINGEQDRFPLDDPADTEVWFPDSAVERDRNSVGRNREADTFFVGKMDEIRLWRTARVGEQIRGYFRQEIPEEHEFLVGLWRFDEGSGIAAFDKSGHGHHAYLGALALPGEPIEDPGATRPTWEISTERVNTGLAFSGAGEHLSIPSFAWGNIFAGDATNTPATEYTLECWLRQDPEIAAGGDPVLTLGFAEGDAFTLRNTPTGGVLQFGAEEVSIPDLLPPGTWVHLALVITADAQLSLIVHHENTRRVIMEQEIDSLRLPPLSALASATLGTGLAGSVDELRLWTSSRTLEEIEANLLARIEAVQRRGPNSLQPLLLGYWPMNENGGLQTADKTPQRNHGDFVANPQERMPRWIETSNIQFDGYLFDGRSELVEIPYDPRLDLTSDFSITAWIEPNRFFGLQGILTKVTSIDESQFALSQEGDTLRFDYETKANNYTLTGGKINDGWNHVAVTVKTREIDLLDLENDEISNLIQQVTAFVRPDYAGVGFELRGKIEPGASNMQEIQSLRIPRGRKVQIVYSDESAPPRQIVETYTADIENLAVPAGFRRSLIIVDFHVVRRRIKVPKIHLYVNGLLVNSGTAFEETQRNGFGLNIGAWGGKVRTNHFHGTIDSVVLWNTALSQREIQTNKDNRLPDDTEGIAGKWLLDSNVARTGVANDASAEYGRGMLGRYNEAQELMLYRPRTTRALRSEGHIAVAPSGTTMKPLEVSGSALTFEYWFRGTRLGQVLSIKTQGVTTESDPVEICAGVHPGSNGATRIGLPVADPTVAAEIATKLQERVTDGDWHHIAIRWEQFRVDGLQVYVDGLLLEDVGVTESGRKALRTTLDEAAAVRIGAATIGELSELRVWGVARPLTLIRRDMRLMLDRGRETAPGVRLTVEEPGLIAYWPLSDSATDTVLELSPDHFDGSATNAPPNRESGLSLLSMEGGVSLNALELSGSGDYIEIPSVPGLDLAEDFTVEMWVKNPNGPLFSRGDFSRLRPGQAWKTCYIKDQKLFFALFTTEERWIVHETAPLTELFADGGSDWHHLAIVFQSRRRILSIYVDAKDPIRRRMSRIFTDNGLIDSPTIRWGMGRTGEELSNADDPVFYSGLLGEFRVWNKAFANKEEISRNKDRALLGTESGLEGLWRFIEREGEQVEDLTQESSPARIIGSNWIVNSGFDLVGLGEVQDSVFATSRGVIGPNCLLFNGTDTSLLLGSPGSLQLVDNLSIECWVLITDLSLDQVLIAKGSPGEFTLAWESGQLVYRHGTARTFFELRYSFTDATGPAVLPGYWHHIVLVRESGINLVQCYLDGRLLGDFARQVTINGAIVERDDNLYNGAPPVRTNHPVLVGAGLDGGGGQSQFFGGRMTELRIWEKVLNAQEIKLYLDRRLRGSEDGLVAYLPLTENPNELDEGDSQTVVISLLHRADRNFTGSPVATAIDETSASLSSASSSGRLEVKTRMERPAGAQPGGNEVLIEYRITVNSLTDAGEVNNFSRLQITENLVNTFGPANDWDIVSRRALPGAKGALIVNPRFDGVTERDLLGITDFSLNENHPVLTQGEFAPILHELNFLNPQGQDRSSVRIRVELEVRDIAMDTFAAFQAVYLRKVEDHLIKLSAETPAAELNATINGETIEPRLTGTITVVEIAAEAAAELGENLYPLAYTIEVRNAGSERLNDLEITDYLGLIFDQDFQDEPGNSWKLRSYSVDREGHDQFMLNPVYNGLAENQLCGLQFTAPEPVFAPPRGVAAIQRVVDDRVAQTEANVRPKAPGEAAPEIAPAAPRLASEGIAKRQSPQHNIPKVAELPWEPPRSAVVPAAPPELPEVPSGPEVDDAEKAGFDFVKALFSGIQMRFAIVPNEELGQPLLVMTAEANMENSNNPAAVIVRDIFGISELTLRGYTQLGGIVAEKEYGLMATATVNSAASSMTILAKSVFGLNTLQVELSGKKTGAETELAASATGSVVPGSSSNPLIKALGTLLGVQELIVSIQATRSGGGPADLIIAGSAGLTMNAGSTGLLKFLHGIFGVDADMAVGVTVTKSGGATTIGATAAISIDLASSSNPFFEFVRDLFQLNTITVSIEIQPDQFAVSIDLGVDQPIQEVHRLVEVYIAMTLMTTPPSNEISLGMAFMLDTGDGIIRLQGQVGVKTGVSGVSVNGWLAMDGQWRNPFGINGLTLLSLGVQLGFQPEPPWLAEIGMRASMLIGRTDLAFAGLINLDDPSQSGVVGSVNNLNMLEVANTFTGSKGVPAGVAEVLGGIDLYTFQLSVIPNPPLVIAGLSYDQGGITAACSLNLWGFKANAFFQLSYSDGVAAFGSFSAFELIPGVLEISAADLPAEFDTPQLPGSFAGLDGPEFYVQVQPFAAPTIYMNGSINLLNGFLKRDVAISISADQMSFFMSGSILDLFHASVWATVATDLSSVYLKVELKNDFFAKIREEVLQAIENLAKSATSALDEAREEVEVLYQEVERQRRIVKKEREAVQRKLRSAKDKINAAQREVNKIRNEISSTERYYDNLPGFHLWKASKATAWIWVGPKLAGLWIAYGVATAALEIAKGLLSGLDALIDLVPIDIDPRVAGPLILYGVAVAGIEIAKFAVQGFAEILSAMARMALGGFFDIRYAMFEGGFSTRDGGSLLVNIKAQIIFLGTPHSISFHLDLKNLDKGVQGLAQQLLDEFT